MIQYKMEVRLSGIYAAFTLDEIIVVFILNLLYNPL
jgi:hypothetical protein